jgi:hypothetical protein
MRKYNLSNIMKRAWELVKKAGMTISSGLKKAWEEAKTIEKKIFEGRMEMTVPEADNNTVSVRLWKKGSYKRIYFNDYKNRAVGYIDCVTRTAHYMNGYARMYVPAIDRFMEEYEF